MAGIVFFFEDYDTDVFSGTQDALCAWNNAIKLAGDIDKVVIVNKSSIKDSELVFDHSLSIEVVKDLPIGNEDCIYLVTDRNIHLDMVDNCQYLWAFDHDIDWYMFGPASGWQQYVNKGLHIPQSGTGHCHSTHIATVVMAHRHGVINQWL